MAKLVIGTDKTVGVPAVVKEFVPVEKYPLLGRVKDDTNKDIGCVVGYHIDANNVKYAVVCLNKEFRSATQLTWLSAQVSVPGLEGKGAFSAMQSSVTATSNCDKIMAMAPDYTSAAVTECRSHSFVIDGTTYYGQLPTLREFFDIIKYFNYLNTNDPSSSGPKLDSHNYSWVCHDSSTAGYAVNVNPPLTSGISTQDYNMTWQRAVVPILEIPIN